MSDATLAFLLSLFNNPNTTATFHRGFGGVAGVASAQHDTR